MVASQTRILIAEDNFINQKVALSIVEKLGYRGFAVGNGLEVIEALKSGTYSVILMDCQMPEMDGYETTERIRAATNEDYTSIPVIALTANAIKGDRERCLAAGMNDYLTKPIRTQELAKMLEKWLPKTTHSTIDQERLDALMSLCNDDGESIIIDLIPVFIQETPLQIASMIAAFEAKDFKKLTFEAHRSKSSSTNMGAALYANICESLEEVTEATDSAHVRQMLDKLAPEFANAAIELQKLMPKKLAS
jgi:CheY-like chemotaxis protein/HPt (histidine-containing phosphotransfer) domain-containing protein